MLSPVIPIFPLPNVVLFPGVFLPLHIFEPRYREMVGDALEGDRVIGMVLLKPEGLGDYEVQPPIYPVGCAGLITHVERLADGRFNIILRGLQKFRVVGEDHELSYRRAQIEELTDEWRETDRTTLQQERQKLDGLLRVAGEHLAPEPTLSGAIADEDLINALAQYLELEPLERLALLEREGALARCRSLIELIEMKLLIARSPQGSAATH
jgi:Lon protease-like protein